MPRFNELPAASSAADADLLAALQVDGHMRAVTRGQVAASAVQKTGDTMTGALALPSNPTSPLQAAPKQYVDAGDATNATATTAAQALAASAVQKAGDTMTGALTLPGSPTAPLQATAKQYVDAGDTTNATAAAAAQTTANAALPASGGTMTGAITLSRDGQNALEPVSFEQFDSRLFGLDVTKYGAVDDLQRGYYTATWSASTKVLSTAYTFVGNVTVANTGPGGVAQITLPGLASNSGLGFFEDWVGKAIAITGAGTAGGAFVALVTGFDYLPYTSGTAVPTWTCNIAAPTPITNSAQNLACPCFTTGADASGRPSVVGQSIWISDAITPNAISTPTTGYYPTLDVIAAVNSPFSVTVTNLSFGSALSSQPGVLIRWFTDNSPAIINAYTALAAPGGAAAGRESKALFFPGKTKSYSTGAFGVLGLQNQGVFTTRDGELARAMGTLDWWTSGRDVEVEVFSEFTQPPGGVSGPTAYYLNSYYKLGIPITAPPPPPLPDECGGPGSFPCSASVQNVPVVDTGDSWHGVDPSGNGVNSVTMLTRWLQRRNKGRNVQVINRGIGGTTWRDQAYTGNRGSAGNPQWSAGGNWMNEMLSVPSPFGSGSVAPALWSNGEGDNDLGVLHPNDVAGTINRVLATTAYNGLPPDILLHTEGVKGVELWSAGAEDFGIGLMEYATGYVRSFARANGYPMIDIGAAMNLAQYGWSPTKLVRRQVPPLPAKAVSPTSHYLFPTGYKVRDYRVMLQLGSGTGQAFWSAIKTLELSLSGKPDNRLVLSTDQTVTGSASGNLYVYWRAWGGIISTPTTIANGSTALATSGQTSVAITSGGGLVSSPPAWTIVPGGTNNFTSGMVGQCYLTPGICYKGQDFRTMIVGIAGSGIIFGCDANDQNAVHVTTQYVGGWMFKAQDSQATANLRITDGSGNTLRTKLAYNGFTDYQHVALQDPWTFTNPGGASVTMELGRFSAPSYTATPFLSGVAQPVGTDTNVNPQFLVIEKTDTRARVSIVLGANYNTDYRSASQAGLQEIWEGDVECFGGEFLPTIWVTGGTVTVTPVWVEIASTPRGRDVFRPTATSRDIMGTADPTYSNTFGGDASHYTRRALRDVFDWTYSTQNLSFGTVAPTKQITSVTTGSSYAMQANDYTVIVNKGTGSATGISGPSKPVVGQTYVIKDGKGDAATNNITFTPASGTVDGAGTAVISSNKGVLRLEFDGTNWWSV